MILLYLNTNYAYARIVAAKAFFTESSVLSISFKMLLVYLVTGIILCMYEVTLKKKNFVLIFKANEF